MFKNINFSEGACPQPPRFSGLTSSLPYSKLSSYMYVEVINVHFPESTIKLAPTPPKNLSKNYLTPLSKIE